MKVRIRDIRGCMADVVHSSTDYEVLRKERHFVYGAGEQKLMCYVIMRDGFEQIISCDAFRPSLEDGVPTWDQ